MLSSVGCMKDSKTHIHTSSNLNIPDFLGDKEQKAEVLLLGTFHFKDAGLDTYKQKYSVDILSEKRQNELNEILEALEAFKPTKIIVERKPYYQPKLDSLYNAFLNGEFKANENEIYQVGFKLAKRLGHERVIAGDQKGRGYPFKPGDEIRYKNLLENIKVTEGLASSLDNNFQERYRQLYSYEDSLKARTPLKEYLFYLNSEDRMSKDLGSYLLGDIGANNGFDYPVADGLCFWWINRNYRIFSNIRKEINSENERVLVLFGAAHAALLRPMVKGSPEMRLVEFKDLF